MEPDGVVTLSLNSLLCLEFCRLACCGFRKSFRNNLAQAPHFLNSISVPAAGQPTENTSLRKETK